MRPEDCEAIVAFLSSNKFPFYVRRDWTKPEAVRFEGQTRADNIAMRKVFLKAGFLKEAHYRMSWPADDGTRVASVAYAILRQDWESGETTSFDWDDLKI